MTVPPLSPDPRRHDYADLAARVRRLASKIRSVSTLATNANTMALQSAKRYRCAVFVTPLTILGSPISQAVKWSSPMPSDSYSVDASCSAIPGTSLTYTITNQTAAGCTVTFNAPVLLAAGTIVMVIAVAPAPTT